MLFTADVLLSRASSSDMTMSRYDGPQSDELKSQASGIRGKRWREVRTDKAETSRQKQRQ